GSVRSSGIFGQAKAISAWLCPKFGGLRTSKGKTGVALSEVRGSSDKQRQIQPRSVRRLGIFGQAKAKPAWLCPKFGDLRTSKGKFSSALSEVQGSSDKQRQNQRGSVRSLGVFGQAKAKLARLCPKFEYLRTSKG